MRLTSFAAFAALQTLFLTRRLRRFPRQIAISKRFIVASTAIEVLTERWTMHIFGIRSDPTTVSLAGTLPDTATLGL